jgi:hypothetical protein
MWTDPKAGPATREPPSIRLYAPAADAAVRRAVRELELPEPPPPEPEFVPEL